MNPPVAADPLATGWQPLPTIAERMARGRTRRGALPRSGLSALTVAQDRDPLGILERQDATRVPELVALRRERMSVSPFTFYRGTAALMAADLANEPNTGISVASCGDAHLSNFGFYASAQRTLVFDLNDFDEGAWAPWEWDLKRLVASIVIAGQATSRDDAVVEEAARTAVRAYARALAAASAMSPLERYFTNFDLEASVTAFDKASRRVIRTAMRGAQRRTGDKAAKKLTQVAPDGRLEFVEDPPILTHTDPELEQYTREYIDDYARSANIDVRMLLQSYAVADTARRVVGVGSVGTRCYVVALQDGDRHPLILQAKEAGRSVLIEHGRAPQPPEVDEHIARHGEGGRVVALQRILQAASDPFLGHLRARTGVDFSVRQFRDMKGGIDAEPLEDVPFITYSQACAVVLARAHAQSPHAPEVVGYLGSGRNAAEALTEWGYAYAALSNADYHAFLAASPTGGSGVGDAQRS